MPSNEYLPKHYSDDKTCLLYSKASHYAVHNMVTLVVVPLRIERTDINVSYAFCKHLILIFFFYFNKFSGSSFMAVFFNNSISSQFEDSF